MRCLLSNRTRLIDCRALERMAAIVQRSGSPNGFLRPSPTPVLLDLHEDVYQVRGAVVNSQHPLTIRPLQRSGQTDRAEQATAHRHDTIGQKRRGVNKCCAASTRRREGGCRDTRRQRIQSRPFDETFQAAPLPPHPRTTPSSPIWVPRSHRVLRTQDIRRRRSTALLPGSARDIYPLGYRICSASSSFAHHHASDSVACYPWPLFVCCCPRSPSPGKSTLMFVLR